MKIHITGIKGIGISAVAQILKNRGHIVVGSDVEEEFPSDLPLRNAGIEIKFFDKKNITKYIDLVIHSTAYKVNEHSELITAKKLGIKIQNYTEALADIFNNYKKRILVVGTHGKTTTTALIGLVLEKAGFDPTVIVGGQVINWQNNVRIGKSDIIVAEGDEYQKKFLSLWPNVLVITNIDYDHPDYFKTEKDYNEAFFELIKHLEEDDVLIASNDDIVKKELRNYHYGDLDAQAYDDYFLPKVKKRFELGLKENSVLALSYENSFKNVFATWETFKSFKNSDINEDDAYIFFFEKAIESFKGIKRRCEVYYKNEDESKIIIDDYAHHPTEIESTLKGIKTKYPSHKIFVLFQPHTYSRTLALMDDFVDSFKNVDFLGLLKTYSSKREKFLPKYENIELELLKKTNKTGRFLITFEEAEELAQNFLAGGGKRIVVTMGAGDVWQLAKSISQKLIKKI